MRIVAGLTAAVIAACFAMPAGAVRMWHRPYTPTATEPQQQAMEYVHIMDIRGPGELVSAQWLPPLSMPVDAAMKTLLGRYVVIAVSHMSFGADGKLDTHSGEVPVALDGDGKLLALVPDAQLPAPMVKFLNYKRNLVHEAPIPEKFTSMPDQARTLMVGYVRNLQFYAFDAGSVRDCSTGRLTIRYAGEDYPFETPIPGCPVGK